MEDHKRVLHTIIIAPFCFLVRFYQWVISPVMGSNCRFFPSCSTYMLLSMERFGLFKGLFLTCRRLLRCHPWCKGGDDPVPNREIF